MTQDRITVTKLLVLIAAVWGAVWLGFGNNPPHIVSAKTSQVKVDTPNDKLVWLDNYEAAVAEAKRTGKPIFLEFRCAP